MTVEALLNPPATQEAWDQWSYVNAQNISEIRQAILAQQNINLTDYQLYPINWRDISNWLIRNQQAHDDFNSALGLPGINVQDADPLDDRTRETWVWNIWSEINAARQALKI